MIKKILGSIFFIIFSILISTKASPLNNLWDENAFFVFKMIFNSIFVMIFSMFVLIAWCIIAFIIAMAIKKDEHVSSVYSRIIFPFKLK